MNRLKATFGLTNNSIKICGYPINGANYLVGIKNNTSDNSDVHNPNPGLSLAK